jgi:hypothetical protein
VWALAGIEAKTWHGEVTCQTEADLPPLIRPGASVAAALAVSSRLETTPGMPNLPGRLLGSNATDLLRH